MYEQEELDESINSSEEASEEQDNTVDNDEEGETNEQKEKQKEEQKPKEKQKSWVPKLLAKNNELKARVEAVEMELAVAKFEKTYWDIDMEKFSEIKQQYKDLSYDDVFGLYQYKYWAKKTDAPQEKPKPKMQLNWKPATTVNTITWADLNALPQEEYNKKMALVEQGKLKRI